jgi:hypothetical protein
MKSVVKKIIMNPASMIILILSFSSMTAVAQQQQRPSQRSFETIMAEVKERKDARKNMQQKIQQPEDKTVKNNLTTNPPNYVKGVEAGLSKQVPAATKPGTLLPSQRPLKRLILPHSAHRTQ